MEMQTNPSTALVVLSNTEGPGSELCSVQEVLPAIQETDALRRIRVNKGAILEAMQKAGIKSVTVEYTGEGDSGNGMDISCEGGQTLANEVKVPMVTTTSTWLEGQGWTTGEEVKELAMPEAVEQFVEELIDQYHSGFENGDGGGGTVTMVGEDGRVNYERYDNIIERECVEIDV